MKHISPALLMIFLVSCLLNMSLFAQDEKNNGISIGIGRQIIDTRDDIESPMMYSAEGQNTFHLLLRHNNETERHLLEFSYSSGTLEASTKNTMLMDLINFRYHYYRNITSFLNGRLYLFAGGVLSHLSSEKQYNMASGFMNISSFDEATSLNLSLSGEYRFNERDIITAGVYSPFVSYILRPNYSLFPRDIISKYNTPLGFFLGEGKFRTVNDFVGLNTWVSVEKSLSSSFSASLNYNFMFYRIKKPAETGIVSNSLNLNLTFLF